MARFDWNNYHAFAESIIESGLPGGEEACCRASISRLYYAAFHSCLKYLKDVEGFTPPTSGGGTHIAVIIKLRNGSDRRDGRKKIANKLEKLLGIRKWADYEAEPECPDLYNDVVSAARECVREVEKIQEEVSALSSYIRR